MAVHPRQQTTIAQADPLVLRAVLVTEGMDDVLHVARRILHQERNLWVNLIAQSQDGHTLCQRGIWSEVATQAIDIRLRMCLDIKEDVVVRISQRKGIFLHIAEDGESHAMDVVTLVATQIRIRISGFHDID